MRVYLAGPDIFLPDPFARAAALKDVCTRHALHGVSPLDDLTDEPACWAALPEARRIALRNELHIRSCQAVIANLTPFRGPSADAGTVFEVGFARALGLPVFAWSNDCRPFADRTRIFLGGGASRTGNDWRDSEGLLLEDFSLSDNLMIEGAVLASGGVLALGQVTEAARWHDLDAFARVVMALAGVR